MFIYLYVLTQIVLVLLVIFLIQKERQYVRRLENQLKCEIDSLYSVHRETTETIAKLLDLTIEKQAVQGLIPDSDTMIIHAEQTVRISDFAETDSKPVVSPADISAEASCSTEVLSDNLAELSDSEEFSATLESEINQESLSILPEEGSILEYAKELIQSRDDSQILKGIKLLQTLIQDAVKALPYLEEAGTIHYHQFVSGKILPCQDHSCQINNQVAADQKVLQECYFTQNEDAAADIVRYHKAYADYKQAFDILCHYVVETTSDKEYLFQHHVDIAQERFPESVEITGQETEQSIAAHQPAAVIQDLLDFLIKAPGEFRKDDRVARRLAVPAQLLDYSLNFSLTCLAGADCEAGYFNKAVLIKADLRDANCYQADFTKACCYAAIFDRADCSQADFTAATCEGSSFAGTLCNRALFIGTNCLDADFTDTKLKKADFTDAVISETEA